VSVVHSENEYDYGSYEWMGNKKVDHTNEFAQAEMKETVYIEAPKLFGPRSGKYLVLLLLKSLYGLKQAPRTFYNEDSLNLKLIYVYSSRRDVFVLYTSTTLY
jgi:hypothetical protein